MKILVVRARSALLCVTLCSTRGLHTLPTCTGTMLRKSNEQARLTDRVVHRGAPRVADLA
jgi:hypothetical protein